MHQRYPHPCGQADDALLQACDVRRGRASGPGGQHRNKVETAVFLHHRESGLKASATERRSQAENLGQALARMRVTLALAERRTISLPQAPSESWRQRVSGRGQLSASRTHADFAILLAEALDFIAAHQGDVAAAAENLSITTSQLVRFLKLEPAALSDVNEQRATRGLRPLR
jgi:hypothetical protein